MIRKEKKRKSQKFFHMGKKTVKCSLVILSALVIHTAPTVELFDYFGALLVSMTPSKSIVLLLVDDSFEY